MWPVPPEMYTGDLGQFENWRESMMSAQPLPSQWP